MYPYTVSQVIRQFLSAQERSDFVTAPSPAHPSQGVGVHLIWEFDPVVDPSREELATINEDGRAVDVTPGVAREEESRTDDLGEVTQAS